MYFPTAGIEVAPWLPPVFAFALAFCSSMAGVSGAFLLLPFQMSVLGFTSPAVSPTNLIYNVVATPSGAWRYIREKRMFWPLSWLILVAAMPGLLIGIYIRLAFLPNPVVFRLFVGVILIYLGGNLVRAARRKQVVAPGHKGVPGWGRVEECRWNWQRITCRFEDETYGVPTKTVAVVAFVVGVVSGVYGIGGSCILAPVLVGVFALPVYIVAGSTLLANFATSVVGVLTYCAAVPLFGHLRILPDWRLGLLFGAGGIIGMYCGARCQKFIPARWIKLMLAAAVFFVAIRYIFTSVRELL